MKKVLMFIIYYPVALIVCVIAWLVSFTTIVILTPFQSFRKVCIDKTETDLDNDIEKSIEKACKMVRMSNESKSSDKDKGGK